MNVQSTHHQFQQNSLPPKPPHDPKALPPEGVNLAHLLVVVELTAEQRADLERRQAASAQTRAESKAGEAAAARELNYESNRMTATNVAMLDYATTKSRIDYITYLIQSGEADNYSFHSANGDRQTDSIHQYLYWLQQRAQTFESDGN